MPVPDAHTRSKITLNPSQVLSQSSIRKALPRIALSNLFFVVALQISKKWLLAHEVGAFWVLMRVLACGGLGVLVWEGMTGQVRRRKSIEWSALALASLLVFVQYGALFMALSRLSAIRVILFSSFSTHIVATLINFTSARKVFAIIAAFALGILTSPSTDIFHDIHHYAPGFAALLAHGFTSTALDHTLTFISPSLGPAFTVATSTLGACLFCIPFYLFRSAMLGWPETPEVPWFGLLAIPFVAFSVLFFTPLTKQSFSNLSLAPQYFVASYPILVGSSAVLGGLVFAYFPSFSDLIIAGLLYFGMQPSSLQEATSLTPRTPASRLIKSYLKAILSNPESRKIFYFLMLNLAYMLVQMLYGVWTNSLGLISDAIHMAFDCMAIGMGLLASVMATWDSNDRFTYGYGRIETLSGFANGIFLILISIFIVFEAIQRILDPPEMNTNQLLLVSSVGLAVNLFGMFAMGGHHHGGGGHSHSHALPFNFWGGGGEDDHSGHSHGDHGGHSVPTKLKNDHHGHSHDAHNHSHSHANESKHGHSHDEHSHKPARHDSHCNDRANGDHSHSHSHSPHSDTHSSSPHSPTHSHSHNGHSPSHTRTHSHSHSPPPMKPDTRIEEISTVSGHSRTPSGGLNSAGRRRHSRAGSLSVHTNLPPTTASGGPLPILETIAQTPPAHGHGHSHSEPVHEDCSGSHGHGHGHEGHGRVAEKCADNHGHGHGHDHKGHEHEKCEDDHGHGKESHNGHTHAKKEHSGHSHDDHHGHSHGHDDHDDHGHGDHGGHSGHSHNMRGVFLHVMADTLGSVGVIISTILIQQFGWTGFDPIASLFIAILIAASVVPLVIDTGRILGLDVGPEKATEVERALDELRTIPGLHSYTSARFWPKDAGTMVGSIHIHLERSRSGVDVGGPHGTVKATYVDVDRVVARVKKVLKNRIEGLENVVVQVVGS